MPAKQSEFFIVIDSPPGLEKIVEAAFPGRRITLEISAPTHGLITDLTITSDDNGTEQILLLTKNQGQIKAITALLDQQNVSIAGLITA